MKLRLGLVIGSNEDTVDDDQVQVRVQGQCLRESLDERDRTARDICSLLDLAHDFICRKTSSTKMRARHGLSESRICSCFMNLNWNNILIRG